jgi:hypothetical protein
VRIVQISLNRWISSRHRAGNLVESPSSRTAMHEVVPNNAVVIRWSHCSGLPAGVGEAITGRLNYARHRCAACNTHRRIAAPKTDCWRRRDRCAELSHCNFPSDFSQASRPKQLPA